MSLSITKLLNGLSIKRDARALRSLLASFTDAIYTSGGLAIHGAASAVVKTANTVYGQAGGSLFSLSAADLPALVGTVTNAKFNVFAFFVDKTGAVTVIMGTEGATLGAVVIPTAPPNTAQIGFVIINPTGTGNFVGGTTALDDATVVPNAAYVNTTENNIVL